MNSRESKLVTIGWREWISVPSLGISQIKAKVDTGAKTSAIHAFDLEYFSRRGQEHVRFKVHPIQENVHYTVTSEAPLVTRRRIKNSGGSESLRPVIEAVLMLGSHEMKVELTLASRDEMGFRMLLGRDAIRNLFLIDAGRSFLIGKKRR